MDTQRLDAIPLSLDLQELKAIMRLRDNPRRMERLTEMVAQAQAVARPKALYRRVAVEGLGEDTVTLDGVTFRSRELRTHLQRLDGVFPFAATCGVELDRWSRGFDNPLEVFWADTINDHVLRRSMAYVIPHLKAEFGLGTVDLIHPGAAADWPLDQQLPLMGLLGDVEAQIGIRFSPNFMMSPDKSLTGILFAAEVTRENDML